MLPGNATAGYQWTSDVQPNAVVSVEPAEYRTSSAAVGSGGEQRWMIRARGNGRATLHWKYWRPWEGDASVVERFDVTVDVG